MVGQLTVSLELSERSFDQEVTYTSIPTWLCWQQCLGESRKVLFLFPRVSLESRVPNIQSCCSHSLHIKIEDSASVTTFLKIVFLSSIAFFRVKLSRKLSQIKGTLNIDLIVTDRCF